MNNTLFAQLTHAARRSGWIILTILAIALIVIASAVIAVAGLFGALRGRDTGKARAAMTKNL
jgi:hypothetical protein